MRPKQVCNGCARHSKLIMAMPRTRKDEAAYHEIFDALRATGECFNLEGDFPRFLMGYSTPADRESLELSDEFYRQTLH